MKIRHLLIGMLAIAGAVACKQDEPVETLKLDVDKATVEVAATAGEASFNVTSFSSSERNNWSKRQFSPLSLNQMMCRRAFASCAKPTAASMAFMRLASPPTGTNVMVACAFFLLRR